MKIREFYRLLRKTRNKYQWKTEKEVRGKNKNNQLSYCECPITAVCANENKGKYTIGNVVDAGYKIGLNYDQIRRIVNASDFVNTRYPLTRKLLQKAAQ